MHSGDVSNVLMGFAPAGQSLTSSVLSDEDLQWPVTHIHLNVGEEGISYI